jgi:hypothetical protein
MLLENDGKPLWDGHSDISVRPATQAEARYGATSLEALGRLASFSKQMTWSANARTDWFF